MFFFPYKADILLNRIPFLTIMVSILCLFIYGSQVSSSKKLFKSAENYCSEIKNKDFYLSIEKITGERSRQICMGILIEIHSTDNQSAAIKRLAGEASAFTSIGEEEGRQYVVNALSEEYLKFSEFAPETITSKLQYEPNSYNIFNMISSSFAHGSIFHLLGNLVFFFAFAATVEIVIRWYKYLFIMLFLSVGVSISYTVSVMNVTDALPTIGLSGVVMGMIGLFTYLMPSINIRCILFFIFILRTVVIPAWVLAVIYIGWDIYELSQNGSNTEVNLVAHISGAIIGFLYGFIFLRNEKLIVQKHILAIK